jgi:alpha-glucosidase
MRNDAMAFENTVRWFAAKFSAQSSQTAMNQLSNHDHSRFLTRTNQTAGRLHTAGAARADAGVDRAVFMEAVVMQMTWTGAPTLYYGDEAGLCGWTDPDNRRTYPWGREDKGLIELHKAIIAVRKGSRALKVGSFEFLYTNYGIISYARWLGRETVICAFNNNEHEVTFDIPVWRANVARGEVVKLLSTSGGVFDVTPERFAVKDGALTVVMPPKSSLVVRG